ncbi:MAG: DUF1150 family protein [Pseudomonadota bacterium]
MDNKITLPFGIDDRTVYVRAVRHEDLPEEVRTKVDSAQAIYAIHDKNGRPLALAHDRKIAFAVARDNDMTPVHVH